MREWLLSTGVSLGTGVTEHILALLISFFFYRDGMAGARVLRAVLARAGGSAGDRLLAVAGVTITGVV